MVNKRTKTDKLLAALETGKEFTVEQLAKRTGLVNVTSTVERLRDQGLEIFTNAKRDNDGNRYYAYRMRSAI